MRKQAKRVNESLHQVLDLKQRQANALEAHFARDQAQDAVCKGRTILVFAIVTTVFLPMSFMAAFFAINIVEFPHNPNVGRYSSELCGQVFVWHWPWSVGAFDCSCFPFRRCSWLDVELQELE